MTNPARCGQPRGMSYADRPVLGPRTSRPRGAHRAAARDVDRLPTVQRWAAAVLVLATVGLAVYVALAATAVWLVGSVIDVVTGGGSASLDALAVARHVAPVLLVGWCTGMATAVGLAPGRALGARAAGLLAGSVGTAAGLVVLLLTGLL